MDSLQKKYRRNKIMIYGALTLGADCNGSSVLGTEKMGKL